MSSPATAPRAGDDWSQEVAAPRRGGRQVIPRPTGAEAGLPAPWAELSIAERRGIDLRRVRFALRTREHALSGPERIALDAFPDPGSPSAVLVPMFEEERECRVVLTRRAAHLRTHTSEVSFPGGRLDQGESPEQAALREACEEIGLDPATVEILGRLTPLATLSSRTTITPVLGALSARPKLAANPTEVEHVFDVSLSELAGDGMFREERWKVGTGPEFPVWFFELDDDTIWGATARMLVELLRVVLAV